MRSANTLYLARLDVMRFLAAAMVILYHTSRLMPAGPGKPKFDFLNAFYFQGAMGVSLFIVMSGFLMTMIYDINPGIRYRDFIYNRFLRVIPLTAIFFLGALAVFQSELPGAANEVINFLTLQYNIDRDHAIAPLWTVAVEFQFYLLFPILFMLKQKKGISYLFGMCAVLAVLRFLLIAKATMSTKTFGYDISYVTLFGRLDQFVIGMWIYDLYQRKFTRFNWVHLPIAIAIAAFYIGEHRHAGLGQNDLAHNLVKTFILTLEGAVWGYFVYAMLVFPFGIPLQRFFAWLGQASFSMYLWHWIILEVYIRYVQPTPSQLISTGLIALAITTAISIASFYWIEKAFLEFKRRYQRPMASNPA